jgi:hypothetical protein
MEGMILEGIEEAFCSVIGIGTSLLVLTNPIGKKAISRGKGSPFI